MANRRERDPKRQGGPWPSPIGMGALASPGDFHEAKRRKDLHKGEEEAFERGKTTEEGNRLAKEYREKHGLD